MGMITTFIGLKGNPRACLWTEPLWGIPYNLYLPYVALYMRALGLTPAEIGYVTSISLAVQIIASVLSGALSDKLGRRRCTLIFDLIAWTIPELLWAFSQNFVWFVAAALLNGLWRITSTSWGLLLTEDIDDDLTVQCFSMAQFMGLLAAFVAPLSKIAVDSFGLVPTMRVIYLASCILMTAKFLILYWIGTETQMGIRRMEETRNTSLWQLIWGCKDVFIALIKEKRMVLTIGVLVVFQTVATLNTSFWSVFVTERLGIPQGDVALYATLKSMVMLACIFVLVPRIRFRRFKNPMLMAWCVFAVSQGLLLVAPHGATLPILIISVAFEAGAQALLSPLVESLLFINADPDERARILGLIYGLMALIVAGFPALAGKLSTFTLAAPFLINLIMLALGAALTIALWMEKKKQAML
jgi:MFS family permease